MHWLGGLLSRIEQTRPFSEDDAWGLYRIAAWAEAGGWTLLIIGILIRHFQLPSWRVIIPITGQIHGTIFLAYFGVLLVTYTSLRWSRRKFLVALVAGVPPYGSLMFEQWAAHTRRKHHARQLFRSLILVQAKSLTLKA